MEYINSLCGFWFLCAAAEIEKPNKENEETMMMDQDRK